MPVPLHSIGCPQPWAPLARTVARMVTLLRAAVTAHNPALPHLRRQLARQVLRDGTALALPVDGASPLRRNGTRATSSPSTGAGSAPCG